MALGAVLLLILPALDRLLKVFAQEHPGATIPILGDVFVFESAVNPFGPLSISISLTVVTILAIVVAIGLAFAFMIERRVLFRFVLLFVAIGAASNFYDRVSFGYIVDTFSIFGLAFNLADLFILAGSLVYFLFRFTSTPSSVARGMVVRVE